MNINRMSDTQILIIRKRCLRSFYTFCKTIMGYDDIKEEPHGAFCSFLERPSQRKQACMPRSFVKTWIGTIAYSIWISLPRREEDEFPEGILPNDKFFGLGPNIRILIASYVITNAEKMIGLIRRTYEANTAMQIIFPDVIPENFKKLKWSNEAACIRRPDEFTESTFEAAGIGGSSTSRHYDLIIEDDLIYANKDDFSGKELQPNQEDIDKAIGWHKIATSLLVPGKHTHIHNIGTRWAKHDLVDYIWANEPDYETFRRACVAIPDDVLSGKNSITEVAWEECKPTWEGVYDHEQLRRIATAQGPYMFATQYLLMPMSPEELLFKPHWLESYEHISDVPKEIRVFTTVDLSEWDTAVRKGTECNSVVLTCGWCSNNHMWILGYDYGRFSPTEMILLMAKHWKLYKPEAIYPESVYYQKALAHFTREYIKMGKVPMMTIRELLPESNKSKDLRIRGLEPLASNHGIHCRKEHKEFITEFTEYIPTNRLCKKDLLDAAAYQIQVARPGELRPLERQRTSELVITTGSIDDFLEHIWKEGKPQDVFGHELPIGSPFTDSCGAEAEMLAEATNPFTSTSQWSV